VTSQNGQEPTNHAMDMDDVLIQGLRQRIESERLDIEAIKRNLQARTDKIRSYEKALQALTGEAVERKPGKTPTRAPVRAVPSKLASERLSELKAMILDIAKDMDEFRQVDLRARATTPALTKSSTLATGFRVLREEGFIRFARQDGNNKYFSLTRAAVNAEAGNAASV